MYSYGANRRAPQPCHLYLTSLTVRSRASARHAARDPCLRLSRRATITVRCLRCCDRVWRIGRPGHKSSADAAAAVLPSSKRLRIEALHYLQGSIVEAVEKQLSGFENWVVRFLSCCMVRKAAHRNHGDVTPRQSQQYDGRGSARLSSVSSALRALRRCVSIACLP